jgi:hypothetical protein
LAEAATKGACTNARGAGRLQVGQLNAFPASAIGRISVKVPQREHS